MDGVKNKHMQMVLKTGATSIDGGAVIQFKTFIFFKTDLWLLKL